MLKVRHRRHFYTMEVAISEIMSAAPPPRGSCRRVWAKLGCGTFYQPKKHIKKNRGFGGTLPSYTTDRGVSVVTRLASCGGTPLLVVLQLASFTPQGRVRLPLGVTHPEKGDALQGRLGTPSPEISYSEDPGDVFALAESLPQALGWWRRRLSLTRGDLSPRPLRGAPDQSRRATRSAKPDKCSEFVNRFQYVVTFVTGFWLVENLWALDRRTLCARAVPHGLATTKPKVPCGGRSIIRKPNTEVYRSLKPRKQAS